MDTTGSYFVVRKKAVPEVLLKVVEAKRLLETGKVASVHEATERLGVSRSFINIRTIFSRSMTILRERRLRLHCR